MYKRLMTLLVFTLLLNACDEFMVKLEPAPAEEETEDMMIEDDDPMNDDDDMIDEVDDEDDDDGAAQTQDAVYTDYSADVLADGHTKVLFFHAAWCPQCRAGNEELLEIFAADNPSLSVYKVDYDSNLDLRSRYGVTYQHTFVVVDGEGNATSSVQGPTGQALRTLIGA